MLALARGAGAQALLPYTTRTLSFSGWSTSVHGDIRTVGMGGASTGLADTFIAAVDSPAGLAMSVGIGDIHYASDDISDGHIQSMGAILHTDSVGLALNLYPWAISAGYLSPYREEDSYALHSLLNNAVGLSVTTRELVLSAARVFWHNRLSVGASLVLGQAVREVDGSRIGAGDKSFSSYTAGASLGVMAQLPKRLLVATSFGAPLHYAGASPSEQLNLALPNFYQSVEVPWRVSAGLGFIPNRFFRADFTLHVLGTTDHTALLRDQAAVVGRNVTVQPRLGAAYVFADYKELKATFFLGTYYESTRVAGTDSRVHGTGGVEARLWIFTTGVGVDLASQYRNILFSFGVDVFGVLARLDMIPTAWTPPYAGMFPRPWIFSDLGLARPLVKNWQPQGPDIDPLKVALRIPKNLGKGIRNAKTELENVAAAMAATNESDAQKEAEAARKAEATRNAELARQAAEARELERAQAADEAEQAKEAAELDALHKAQAKRRRTRKHVKPAGK